MTFRSVFGCSAALIVLLCLFAGCSNTDVTTTPITGPTPSTVASWFPLTPGYSATFEIRDADGATHLVTFKVGSSVPFGSKTAYQWFVLENGSVQDTDYVAPTSDAIFIYESPSSLPEQVLRVPVITGSSWYRYNEYVRDTISIITGGEDPDTTDYSYQMKIFPSAGSNEMRVARVDQLTLDNGSHYSGAAEITNSNPGGTTNHYWFAPGLGLVKYVIGATEFRPNGQASGEMVSFTK